MPRIDLFLRVERTPESLEYLRTLLTRCDLEHSVQSQLEQLVRPAPENNIDDTYIYLPSDLVTKLTIVIQQHNRRIRVPLSTRHDKSQVSKHDTQTEVELLVHALKPYMRGVKTSQQLAETMSASQTSTERHEAAIQETRYQERIAQLKQRAEGRAYDKLVENIRQHDKDQAMYGSFADVGQQLSLGATLVASMITSVALGYYGGRFIFGSEEKAWICAIACLVLLLMVEATILIMRLSRNEDIEIADSLGQQPWERKKSYMHTSEPTTSHRNATQNVEHIESNSSDQSTEYTPYSHEEQTAPYHPHSDLTNYADLGNDVTDEMNHDLIDQAIEKLLEMSSEISA